MTDMSILPTEISDRILAEKAEAFVANNWDSDANNAFYEMADEQEQAMHAPAVEAILDTSLTILEHPESNLPGSTASRKVLANSVVIPKVLGFFVEQGTFVEGFLDPELRGVDSIVEGEQAWWEERGSLMVLTLSTAPVADVYRVVNGAAERLLNDGYEDPLPIILASRSLVAVAGMDKNMTNPLFAAYGGTIRPEYFDVATDGEVEISFSDEFKRDMLYGSEGALGCPAARFRVDGQSLTDAYWDRIASYILSPGYEIFDLRVDDKKQELAS